MIFELFKRMNEVKNEIVNYLRVIISKSSPFYPIYSIHLRSISDNFIIQSSPILTIEIEFKSAFPIFNQHFPFSIRYQFEFYGSSEPFEVVREG